MTKEKRMGEILAVGGLLMAVAPMFFYKLGQSSLVSWDEAWYAEIGKQILRTGDLWVMRFNDNVFTDHPPVGFWLVALGQKVWGANEFGSRVMSAIFGILGVAGTYLLGRVWYGKAAGWGAGLALVSVPWYLYRSRTGNLDIFLTAFFVWTIYLAWKSREDRRFFWLFWVAVTMLFLTKTMVPLTIIPALAVVFWGERRVRIWEWAAGILGVGAVIGVWAGSNMTAAPNFIARYLSIGLPGVGRGGNLVENIRLAKAYLHNGIGRWFWFGAMAAGFSVLARRRNFLIPVVLIASVMAPFAFSARGQIWHMIPAYPFLLLILFGVMAKFGRVTAILFCLWLAVPMAAKNWREFVDIPVFVSDEQILATEARNYKERLYLDENFVPAAVFYADKHVEGVLGNIDELYAAADADFLLITHDWRLAQTTVPGDKYLVLAKDRDKVLVRFDKY